MLFNKDVIIIIIIITKTLLLTTNGSGGAEDKRKKFLSHARRFFEKQKENKVCIQAIAYIAISCNGLAHIMKGAGLVRLLDGWNTDSVLVPLLFTF